MTQYYNVEHHIATEFETSLQRHIAFVSEAAIQLNVSNAQIKIHDQSKWSEAEFPGYARHFHGGGAPDEFARAWLHHIHHNQHHWQYWIFPDFFTPPGSSVENGVVEMPQKFALEMVADWMGASRAYTGSWDMAAWLETHIPKIRVHSQTAAYLREVLDGLGYADIVNIQQFGGQE